MHTEGDLQEITVSIECGWRVAGAKILTMGEPLLRYEMFNRLEGAYHPIYLFCVCDTVSAMPKYDVSRGAAAAVLARTGGWIRAE